MDMTWAVETHGDPLGSVNKLVERIWMEAGLEGMMVSADTMDEAAAGYHLLAQPGELDAFNPFRPAMRANTARFVPGVLAEKPAGRYGAVLRPCEIRTLNQLQALDLFPRERLVTICVDCLGTFPAEDLDWRTERQGSADGLAKDTLKFARQGGISVDRYRPACQVCRSSTAEGADFNIWVIGLPARHVILLNVPQDQQAGVPHFADLTQVEPDTELMTMRQRVLNRVNMRNQHSRERFVQELEDLLPPDVEAIAQHLEQCGDCRKCLDACPICAARSFKRGPDGRYNRREVAQWLASCAGCGMCEQACSRHIPLSAIFGVAHEQMHTH